MRINRRLINSTKGISSKLRVFILVILCPSGNFSRLVSIINAWRNPAVMGSRYLVQWVLKRSWNFDRSLQRLSRRKLAWFGQVTRHDSLSKTILQGTLEGGQHRGRERKCWMDSIKDWTSLPMPELITRASCRKDWKMISSESSLMSPDDLIGQGTKLSSNCQGPASWPLCLQLKGWESNWSGVTKE